MNETPFLLLFLSHFLLRHIVNYTRESSICDLLPSATVKL